MTNIKYITKHLRCTGCGACVSFCPKHAITIERTSMGRLFASINESKCINCGLCEKICPNSNYNLAKQFKATHSNTILKVYIGHSKKKKIYQNSQSGGVVTQILFDLLSNGTIDAALCCKTGYSTNGAQNSDIAIITNPFDLFCTQKSFYSPVSILANVKSLNQYRSIAIVGLPCQVNAIRNLERLNLLKNIHIVIGLVCDRTMTHTCNNVIHAYVSSGKTISSKTKIIFKDKNYDNKNPNAYRYAPMTIEYLHKEKHYSYKLDNQLRLYLKDYFTSPRCLVCLDKLNSLCDIVCGDPWGMKEVDWKFGDSLVISRTDKGHSTINQILTNKSVTLTPSTFEDAYIGQKIDERIDMAVSAIEQFKNKGIHIYPDTLTSSMNKSISTQKMQKRVSNMIKRFLYYECHEKDFIIKDITKKAKLHITIYRIQTKIKSIIHHFV